MHISYSEKKQIREDLRLIGGAIIAGAVVSGMFSNGENSLKRGIMAVSIGFIVTAIARL